MLNKKYLENIAQELESLKTAGLYKKEYEITSPQSAQIKVKIGNETKEVLNFCANNYLGLANHPELVKTATDYLDKYAFGVSSVRFICGTMDINRIFENKMAKFLGYEDVISFASCFQANNGIFQALLGSEDAIISANLNHASIIDGIRLCKAQRFFYQFDNMLDLEDKIKQAIDSGCKNKLIVSDGVFSMDGDIADLNSIQKLANKYDCITMIDDCHATGFVGENGKGTFEYCGLKAGDIDIISSTIGKSLGGASGGFIASKKEIIEKLRNTHRGYLFSNNLIPSVAAASAKVIDILLESKDLINKLQENTIYFRNAMTEAGFNIRAGEHAIVPVMLYDAKLASNIAKFLIEEQNLYVIAFSYPVVPKDEARIRVQISASHTKEQLQQAIGSFKIAGKKFGVI